MCAYIDYVIKTLSFYYYNLAVIEVYVNEFI